MVLEPIQTLYPFAEMFDVDTNGTTAVEIWDIPKGTIITMVLAEIKVAGVGSGGDIIIGDDDDDNGYILAGTLCGGTVGTIFGDAVAERGIYLTNSADANESHAGKWKVYRTATKTLKMDCSVDMTTEGTMRVSVFGYRYKV